MADPPVAALLDRDLSDPDLGQLKAGQLEIERKDARLTMRLPRPMLDAVKRQAKARGIPYQRLAREAIQKMLAIPERG